MEYNRVVSLTAVTIENDFIGQTFEQLSIAFVCIVFVVGGVVVVKVVGIVDCAKIIVDPTVTLRVWLCVCVCDYENLMAVTFQKYIQLGKHELPMGI